MAIVDAYDDPNAEKDLATYRSNFSLPACTTANGCFQKVDQNGGTSYPSGDTGWAQEISLDLDMVSAICPNCHILLVEASSNNLSDLGAAVNTAVKMGARVVSNSYGGSEYSSETSDEDSYFNHPGVAIIASSGDSGYGLEFPAASRYVTAVGGTSLNQASSSTRGWSETVWKGAGSGCSSYITKPTWQHDSGCSKRTVADVSAIADPSTGVAVYDSYGSSGQTGWLVFGGTSVAAPIIGSIYALAGNSSVNAGSAPYGKPADLNDVTSGSNGSCSPSYLCSAAPGYDGPTGLGTPNGVGAFQVSTTPDFSVGISPSSQSVSVGGSATYTVTLWAANSYASTVNLSVSGLPSGASASFSSSSVTPTSSGATSTLKVTTGSNTPAGGATLTVTGAGTDSGKLQHTITATLAVGADFSLSVSPSSATGTPGAAATYTVALTALNGYGTPVSLAVGGLPSGATASFGSNPLTPASPAATTTLTISIAAGTANSTSQLTITGTGGDSAKTSHSATVTLSIATPDFTMTVSPSSQKVNPGASVAFTVTLTAANNYNSSVALGLSGLPSSTFASFSPTVLTPSAGGASATLNITTTMVSLAGAYPLTITASGFDSGSTRHSANIALTIASGDFSIEVTPPTQTVPHGGMAVYQVAVITTTGYNSPVTVAVTGQPAGASTILIPTTVQPFGGIGRATLLITTTSATAPGTFTLTLTAVGSDASKLQHTAAAQLILS